MFWNRTYTGKEDVTRLWFSEELKGGVIQPCKRIPSPRPRPTRAHLFVVVLAEAEPLGEHRKNGKGRAREGRPEPELLRRGGGRWPRRTALDVMVLGEAHALVRADTVVAQVFLAVEAARRGGVALVARAAAVRSAQQQRRGGGGRAGRRLRRRSGGALGWMVRVVPVVAVTARAPGAAARSPVLGRRLVGGGHHGVQQVAEQESGRRQRVHARRLG